MDAKSVFDAGALMISLHAWLIAAGVLTLIRIGYILWRTHRELEQ